MAGTYLSPIAGKVQISQAWGVKDAQYAAGHHTGLDFSVKMGTPVMAVADGIVRRSGSGADYGNYIQIEHPDGTTTLYAHLATRIYVQGQKVKAGAVIGKSGSSGNSSGPHLHFEVRTGTSATGGGAYRNNVDPMKYLSTAAVQGMKTGAAVRGATSGDNPQARGAPQISATGAAGSGIPSTTSGGGSGPVNVTYTTSGGGAGAAGGEVAEKPLTAQDFGFSSTFLKANPDINRLVERAIREDWTVTQFQGRVIDTPWYRQRTDAQRTYDQQALADPATWKEKEKQMLLDLTRLAKVMGVSTANLQTEAKNAVRNGLTANDYIGFLSTRANYSDEQVGRAGEVQQTVLEYADAYGITAGPDEVNRIMRDVLSTADYSENLKNYEDHFRERAKMLYSGVAQQIDNGATVKDILDPYLSRAADMLGKPREQMSAADGQWNRAITGEKPMTLQEWEKQVRTDKSYRWDKGPQAMEWARETGDEFMKAFGAHR